MEIFKIYGIIKRKIKEIIHMPFVAAPVKIPEDIHHILSKFSKSRTLPARQVQRAKIILLAADGMNNMQISTLVGLGQDSVSKWRGVSSKLFPFCRRLLKRTVPIWKMLFLLSLMTAHVRDNQLIIQTSRSSRFLRLPAVSHRNLDMRSVTGVSICL